MDQKEKIDAAIEAHIQWYAHLRMAVTLASSGFKPEVVRTDNNCEFGKWLYGNFPTQGNLLPLYQEIKELHARFHIEAGKILELALQKKREEALTLMDFNSEFKKISTALIEKMNHVKKL